MATNAVNKNVIVPEVYAELVREKIDNKIIVSQAAEIDTTLMGKAGETLTFPKWKYIGDASDIAVGAPMDTTMLEQSQTSATIKMIAPKGVKVNDYDNAVAMGNAIEEGASQQAVAIARKIDKDVIAEARKTPLQKKIGAKDVVTFEELNAALLVFGEDCNVDEFAFIALHSNFVPSLLGMAGFVDATMTFNKEGNGIQLNNVIGYFRGIPVVVSDACYDTTNAEGFILIIKKGALKIVEKETVFVETDRDAATRTTTVYTSQYFTAFLADDSKVVLAQTVLPTIG